MKLSNWRSRHTLFAIGLAALSNAALSNTVIAEEKAKPIFKDGQAQVVPEFKDQKEWIRHDLFVETEFDSDGDGAMDRVHVSVTRQKQTDTEGLKVPVVYVTSPYFAGTNNSKEIFWNPKQELGETPPERIAGGQFEVRETKRPVISNSHIRAWVPRGYAVVHSSSPGTGLSQGCPTVGGDNESLAPKAVIDWLCGRAKGFTEVDGEETVTADWCTGKVGMTGTSYNGTLPLAAATTGVEGLEAIIPIAPNTSYYHYYRSNGLIRHPGGYLGEDIDVLYDFIFSGNQEFREYCDCEVRDEGMNENQDRITGDYNDFWAERDYLNEMEPMKAALLMAHAFNDWNVMPEHSVRIYEAAKAKGIPTQSYFHQGGHGGEPPMEQMNRWFTRYLFDVKNDVESDPKAWIVREGAERSDPTSYDEYPNPEAKPVTMFLAGNGSKAGKLLTKAREAAKPQTLIDDVSLSGSELAKADQSPNRLLFVTPTLEKPLHISGYSKLKIRVASSEDAANLSIWLVSLPWNEGEKVLITDNIITRGWADPQNYKSLTESEPLVPGKFYDLSFDLQPDDQIIPAGQQIGLMIFSSDQDFTLHPEAGTKVTVDLNGTSLELPVVGGMKAVKAAFKAAL